MRPVVFFTPPQFREYRRRRRGRRLTIFLLAALIIALAAAFSTHPHRAALASRTDPARLRSFLSGNAVADSPAGPGAGPRRAQHHMPEHGHTPPSPTQGPDMTIRDTGSAAERDRFRPSADLENNAAGHLAAQGESGVYVMPGASQPARGAGWGLLTAASCLLFLLAAAQGYVSFRAQYAFVDHAKHARLPSMLEALGLDTGAVIFALLALSLARRGSRAAVERTLNLACAVGSLLMNLLAADLTSPRSVTVWVLPSALYALASDRLIAVVRRWVQAGRPADDSAQEGSAWHAIGGLAMWLARLALDAPGTTAGFRRWVLAAAPVAPGVRATLPASEPQASLGHEARLGLPRPAPASRPNTNAPPGGEVAPGETKRAALIRLYEHCGAAGDPRYGDRARAAALAGEIAGRIGYHPGTARRELVRYLASRNDLVNRPGAPAGATEAKA